MITLRSNVGTSVISTSGNSGIIPNGPSFAKGLGRKVPFQGSGSTIITEISEDEFTEDAIGMAYDSDTVFVRCRTSDSWSVGTEDNLLWVPVPKTLPADYTINNKRNVFPFSTFELSGVPGFANTIQQFKPQYNSSSTGKPIRTEDGIYQPKDLTDIYVWGPHARADQVLGYGIGGGGAPSTNDLGLHPGFRAVASKMFISEAAYAATASQSWTFETYLDGSLIHSNTIDKTDLVHIGGQWVFQTAAIDISGSYPATGNLGLYRLDVTKTAGSASGDGTHFLSPRVDIPLPWTTSSGNLVIPGGILTGSIPGF